MTAEQKLAALTALWRAIDAVADAYGPSTIVDCTISVGTSTRISITHENPLRDAGTADA